jgi:hypothetical protein
MQRFRTSASRTWTTVDDSAKFALRGPFRMGHFGTTSRNDVLAAFILGCSLLQGLLSLLY